jgi:hypothetical protein
MKLACLYLPALSCARDHDLEPPEQKFCFLVIRWHGAETEITQVPRQDRQY